MTVTFVTPTAGQNCGIGATVRVTTDVIGPIAGGSHWEIRLWDPTTGAIAAMMERVDIGHATNGTLGFNYLNSTFLVNPWTHEIRNGVSLQLLATLLDPSAGTTDSGQISVTNDVVSGLPYWSYLLALLVEPGNIGSQMDTVLAAVRQPYQNAA